MDVTIEGRSEEIAHRLVRSGRFVSPRDMVEDARRLADEHEAKLVIVRAKIQTSLDDGGEYTDKEVGVHLDNVVAELERDMEKAHT